MSDATDVRVSYFFSDTTKFPWDWYGGVPKVGAVHSYLCSMLAEYSPPEMVFLLGRPSWSELVRFSQDDGGNLAETIVLYCKGLLNKDSEDVECSVLRFLEGFRPFKEDFQKKVNHLYRTGRIWVPEECRPYE